MNCTTSCPGLDFLFPASQHWGPSGFSVFSQVILGLFPVLYRGQSRICSALGMESVVTAKSVLMVQNTEVASSRFLERFSGTERFPYAHPSNVRFTVSPGSHKFLTNELGPGLSLS